MAQILEEVVVIKLSKLVKSGESGESVVTPDIIAALEQVAAELVGSSVVVEVEIA
jgi:purine nucleoside phosphorylase